MSEVLWSPPDPASTNWSRFAGFVGVAADQLHQVDALQAALGSTLVLGAATGSP